MWSKIFKSNIFMVLVIIIICVPVGRRLFKEITKPDPPLTAEELQQQADQKAMWEPSEYRNVLEGKVSKIDGTLPRLIASSIAVYGKGISGGGNTTAIGEATYILHVDTSDGEYVIDVRNDSSYQSTYSLASTIAVGTVVRFPTTLHSQGNQNLTEYFSVSKLGRLSADLIEIPSREKTK
jgi:hypothetical protein